ncbi:MAG TPA: cytochrome c oxidase subunit 3 [Gaiellaceae bacterium]|nr:cytochrome c oxidase subunit 3 [Gaiellaceae bacterium]
MDAGVFAVPRPRARRPVVHEVTVPVISNTRLAMLIVIAAESMLFAGLIGMYLVFRLAARDWPPPTLPRLPLLMTAANTVVLLASLVPLGRALRAVRRGDGRTVVRGVAATALLGALFLAVQGLEWVRLVHHGLTLGSGMYGATFYTVIGCHAAHVLIAVTWLAVVALLARRGAFTAVRHAGLEMCATYWYFVCGLWLVLFPLVYLY